LPAKQEFIEKKAIMNHQCIKNQSTGTAMQNLLELL